MDKSISNFDLHFSISMDKLSYNYGDKFNVTHVGLQKFGVYEFCKEAKYLYYKIIFEKDEELHAKTVRIMSTRRT